MSGILHNGVWLPEGEKHLVEVMSPGHKNHYIVQGKATYQYRKIRRAIELQPLNRRGMCIDVGAHVGLWSMWLTEWFELVVAFEPIEEYRELYKKNVSGNYWLHSYALGNENKDDLEFIYPEESTGSTHRSATTGQDVRVTDRGMNFKKRKDISVRRLDDYSRDGMWSNLTTLDFMKIDVEGMELDVVKGAKETIIRNRPNIIIEQKGNDHLYFGHERGAAVRYLTDLGMIELDRIAGDYFMGWKDV